MSKKHLPRYVAEFQGRNNQRPLGDLDRMKLMVRMGEGKRLRFEDLRSAPGSPQPVEIVW